MGVSRASNAIRRTGGVLLVLVLLAGCRTWSEPVPVERVGFLDRVQTRAVDDLTISVVVPDREETEAIFGTSLYRSRIQPVWVEVENRSGKPWTLLKTGMDRDYYSALEVAWKRKVFASKRNEDIRAHFYSLEFPNPVAPGETASGFVFTNLDEGYKAVLVDLVASGDVVSQSFVVEVPGLVTDLSQTDFEALDGEDRLLETEAELRQVLAGFPCCTTNKDGDDEGDPLNIVLVGNSEHIFSALIRSGWHATEVTYGASALKTVQSFLFGTRYLYSPISALYVFGRQQDLGLQKARASINQRNHMRLWHTPYVFRGQRVWLGQISRDIGVAFSKRTITTHAIDPDVDETRNGLIGDLAYSQSLAAVAFVGGSRVSTLADPAENLTPQPYYSDGLRAVMLFSERPRGLDEIEFLDWERPTQARDRQRMLEEFRANRR